MPRSRGSARRAAPRTASSSCSGGTTRFTSPHAGAVSASIGSPVSPSSSARFDDRPPARPRRAACGRTSRPCRRAWRRRRRWTRPRGRRSRPAGTPPRWRARAPGRRRAGEGPASSGSAACTPRAAPRCARCSAPARSAKSWPAEKTGPLAARITARAPESAAAASAAASSRSTSRESAFRRSGRCSVIVRNSSSDCVRTSGSGTRPTVPAGCGVRTRRRDTSGAPRWPPRTRCGSPG